MHTSPPSLPSSLTSPYTKSKFQNNSLFTSFFNLPSHLFPPFASLLLLLSSLACLLSQVSPFFLSLSHNHKSALIFQNIIIYSYIDGKGIQNLLLFYKISDASLVYNILCFSLSQQQQKTLRNWVEEEPGSYRGLREMDTREIFTKIFLLFCLLLCPGTSDTRKVDISTDQKDITTPITTVPTIIPTTPTSSSPVLNPNSNPDLISPVSMTPITVPTTMTTPVSSGGSWCVASQSASQSALQVALDYACGYGGADCAAIQAGGGCYNSNNVHAIASYAFNSYYQKNPVPSSCNFGGTAVTTSTDPSSGTCQYQSTSTSSSVLNTTNSNGSNVFGAVPSYPSPSTAFTTRLNPRQPFFITMACFILLLARYYQ